MPGPFPSGRALGDEQWAHVDVYSLSAVANIGFGAFVNVGGSVDVQVLVQNYLYTSEVAPSDTTTIKSFVYGAGFRVALAMYDSRRAATFHSA
jgi:hypothetical protein